MPSQPITITEAARHFSDFINRVAYRQESFFLMRGKRAVAELRPVPVGRSFGEWGEIVAGLPSLNEAERRNFVADLRKSRAGRPSA